MSVTWGRILVGIAVAMCLLGVGVLEVLSERGQSRVLPEPSRIGEQRCVQAALRDTGLGRWRELGPREIGLEEFIGDDEPAAGVAVEQMVSAGEPEVLHVITSLLSRAIGVYCRGAS